MGSSFPLVMLLRRIGRGLPQTGMDNDGNGVLDNDNVEEDNDELRGEGP
jgi:hypothetical protein